MTTEAYGGCPAGCANGSLSPFSGCVVEVSSLELRKPKPSTESPEETASVAVIDGCDPSEMGSLSHSVRPPSYLSRPVKIKEEVEEDEVAMITDSGEAAAAVSASCSWQAVADDMARPMEGLGEAGPTPFLRKTYEMVSEPGTDTVVSWGSSRDSFVVWDQHEFAKQVLPRYFKHSNFSSFIRQLNTYGFRKIDTERWEFANKGFQGGKKHLLKSIKRRDKFSKQRKTSSSNVTSDYMKARKEAELESLKKDQEALKADILKLREERENSQYEIDQVVERVRHAEGRHQQMFLFLSKAAKSPNFVQHIIQRRRQKRELDSCEPSKKSGLLGPDGEATQSLLKAMDPEIQSPNADCLRISDDSAQMESWPNIVLKDFETIQLHTPWPSPTCGTNFRVAQGQTLDKMAGVSPSHLSSVFHEMSEKLLRDNVVIGYDAADVDLVMNDSQIYLELEGLIEKPRGWSEHSSELVEQAAGLMPCNSIALDAAFA